MKKTSSMQKMHALLSSKAWRNGMALLLLLCFVGTTQVSAQSNSYSNATEEFVTSTEALKLLQAKKAEYATVKLSLLSPAEYATGKFYAIVAANIQNGQTVEQAIENANTKVSQKSAQVGTFTISDVATMHDEVEEYLRN